MDKSNDLLKQLNGMFPNKMIMHFKWCLFISVLSLSSCGSGDDETTVQYEQVNDSIYTINFADHHIAINAHVSGRIVSYMLEDRQLLIPRDMHEEYFGSTLWPAPQAEWNWPPPPQLDGEPYQVNISEDGIYMESEQDSVTGLQFGKLFSFNDQDTSFVMTYSIKNLNDTPRYAAPWEVTRVKGGLSFFPIGEEPILPQSNLKSVSVMDDIVWFSYNADSIKISQKLFSSGGEGWLAHVAGRLLFVKNVQDIHPLKTAPGQGEVEIFASHRFPYIELENHGKYTLLEPNEFVEWRVKWFLRPLRDVMEIKKGNMHLVKQVRSIIELNQMKRPL